MLFLPPSSKKPVAIFECTPDSPDSRENASQGAERGNRFATPRKFDLTPASSEDPLSFEELVGLINAIPCEDGGEGGLLNALRDSNAIRSADISQLEHFARVSSEFYAELGAYYAEEAREWREAALKRF